MFSCKCSNCGGEVEVKDLVGFKCQYCGARTFLSDEDFKGHEEFRVKLLEYYKEEAISKELDYKYDTLWKCNDEENYTMANGQNLNIKYMYKYHYNDSICYLGRENVIYVFKNKEAKDIFLNGINKLVFPEADNKLNRCFPKLKLELSLEKGKEVLAFVRKPNFYPAELFAPYQSVHLAWVISRMENICCELKYSGIEYCALNSNAIWVNPITHEGALFGDWSKVRPLRTTNDLADLRKVAIRLTKDSRNPLELYNFLNSRPEEDAFKDFEKWDTVIEKGFGGHNFVKM